MKIKLKSKKKILLKKKEESEVSFLPNKRTVDIFLNECRSVQENHIPSVIRKWYEDCFEEFPPWDKYGFEFCKARIAYHLAYNDYVDSKMEVPTTVEQNYKATQAFNIDALQDNTMVKFSILKELRERSSGTSTSATLTGGDQMARQKTKKVSPAKAKGAVKEKVGDTWVRLFTSNSKKKLSDDALAKEMQKAHPGQKTYTAKDVAQQRSYFNRGSFPVQAGKKPKVRSESYGGKPSKNGKLKTKVKKKILLKKKK